MNPREAATAIFLAGLAGVQPDWLVRQQMAFLDLDLPSVANLFVVGAGKAGAIMAREVEALLGPRITAGHVVVKYGHACPLQRIRVTEAGHPTPDANSFQGADEILRLAQRAAQGDIVLCLLSGGASALLADRFPGASPGDIIQLNEALVRCGADIAEINAVRKHLSLIKGGQLARAIHPARLVSLILSDVIGDPLDVIASGPTAPDSSTFQDAWGVVEKHRLGSELAPGLLQYLREGIAGQHPETPKIGEPWFQNTTNHIIGNNRTALVACQKKAIALGFSARIVNEPLYGGVNAAATSIINAMVAGPDHACLLFGGETTVQVTGTGLGGRNQHLALELALRLENKPGFTILAGGTDGSDGPTPAAGAVVDSQTVRFRSVAADCLRRFDSYHFFQQAGGHILTGPTFTNVMDIVVALTGKRSASGA